LPQYDLLTERKEEQKEDNIVWQKYKKQELKKGNNDSHIEAHIEIGL